MHARFTRYLTHLLSWWCLADGCVNGNLRMKIMFFVCFVTHACTFYSLFHALAVMTMFRAWSPSTHVARYFTHLLHIGLLGLFPSTASLDAVCSVFHVLAALLPSESYCLMCSKSEANATNSSEFELACGGDFARCRQPRKKTKVRNLYFDCYLSHLNSTTWDCV